MGAGQLSLMFLWLMIKTLGLLALVIGALIALPALVLINSGGSGGNANSGIIDGVLNDWRRWFGDVAAALHRRHKARGQWRR